MNSSYPLNKFYQLDSLSQLESIYLVISCEGWYRMAGDKVPVKRSKKECCLGGQTLEIPPDLGYAKDRALLRLQGGGLIFAGYWFGS